MSRHSPRNSQDCLNRKYLAIHYIAQVYAVVATVVYSGIGSFILLMVTRLVTGGLRVNEEEEREGLDVVLHGERLG